MATGRKVYVVGVGMTKFEKPGRRDNFDYPQMAKEAGTKALQDAGIPYNCVDQVCAGYVYGDSTCGQRAVYQLGMTGVPIYNVNNACATGSTALFMAKQFIEGGLSECVMALGFEKMESGSLGAKFTDRTSPMDRHVKVLADTFGIEAAPITPQMFGNAGREHMQQYGTTLDHFAKVAYKNHLHSVNNPYAQFQKEFSMDQIKSSPMVHEPLTKLQCCPTSDGSAAAILCSEQFVHKHHLEGKAIEIVAMTMKTDFPSSFRENSCMKMVGFDVSKAAAAECYQKTGYSPKDVDVVELHDCFSANELITYEALGLCEPGEAGKFIDRGDNTYGGKYVVNPSGGLISKGHPLGATGLAQCSELCWQLRGEAGPRQVANANLALQHNIGLGGAVVVAIYRLGFPQHARSRTNSISSPTRAAGPTSKPKSAFVFDEIESRLKTEGATIVKKVKGSFLFIIKSDDGKEHKWLVDLKTGSGTLKRGAGATKGDCTVRIKDSDFMDLVSGKLSPQKAFFDGKLKLAGNTALAMKLQNIIPKPGQAKL